LVTVKKDIVATAGKSYFWNSNKQHFSHCWFFWGTWSQHVYTEIPLNTQVLYFALKIIPPFFGRVISIDSSMSFR